MLRNMVQNMVSTYKCPFCSANKIDEKNIDIVGAAGNTVNIDMHCPSCQKHFMVKTELMQIELSEMNLDKLAKLKQNLEDIKAKM